MKKVFLLLVVGLYFSLHAKGSNTDYNVLFDSANHLYQQSDFRGAISVYKSISDSGYTSAELFYNLGNSYFKTGEFPKAILLYERSKVLEPSNPDIEFNLAKAKAYNVDQIESIPEFIFNSWVRDLVGSLNSNAWAVMSLITFFIAIISLILYFLVARKALRQTAFVTGIILLIVSVFFIKFSHTTKAYIEKSDYAIAMEPTISVKGSPDLGSVDLFLIHQGTKVKVLRNLDEWSEIKLSDGKQGWLQSVDIEHVSMY